MLYIIGIILAVGGIGVRFFKWDFLISGYNTMNEEEKANVDIENIRNLFGNFLIIISILFFISAKSYNIGKYLILLVLPITAFVLIRAQKYNYNKTSNKSIKSVITLIVIIFVLLGALFLFGSKDPEVNITDDRIVVEGMYGTTINRDKIQEITLEDQIPEVKRKVEGFDLGFILRGTFNLEDIGTATLFINSNKSPYVVIKADDKYFIINFKDSDKTIELYNSIK